MVVPQTEQMIFHKNNFMVRKSVKSIHLTSTNTRSSPRHTPALFVTLTLYQRIRTFGASSGLGLEDRTEIFNGSSHILK